MEGNRFKAGTMIRGKDLRGYALCKIISEDMKMRGFQYKMGMNEDTAPPAAEGSGKAGLYFCLAEDICKFLGYGTVLATVRIPDEEEVYVDAGKFRVHRLEIREVMPLNEVPAWEYLVRCGFDITENHNYAVRIEMARMHLKAVRYLLENGADIEEWDDHIRQIKENSLEEGTIVKGKKLAGYILCKIMSEDMNMRGYQYRVGINLDINPPARKGNYCCDKVKL